MEVQRRPIYHRDCAGNPVTHLVIHQYPDGYQCTDGRSSIGSLQSTLDKADEIARSWASHMDCTVGDVQRRTSYDPRELDGLALVWKETPAAVRQAFRDIAAEEKKKARIEQIYEEIGKLATELVTLTAATEQETQDSVDSLCEMSVDEILDCGDDISQILVCQDILDTRAMREELEEAEGGHSAE